VEFILIGVLALASVLLFTMVMRNFRNQRDFEGTGRIPPEEYD
jgi:hypothetical protein